MARASGNKDGDVLAREIAQRHRDAIGGPIRALREIVEQRGFISQDDAIAVAEVFNLSRAEVRGIVSFYADLRTKAPARHVVRVCQAEACQSVGSRQLTHALTHRLGIALGEATPDARVELEAVYCLGLCACGPAVMVNDRLMAHAIDAGEVLRGLD
jgi:formate dehydrogenase subunit gamma